MVLRYNLLILIVVLFLSACAGKPSLGKGTSTTFTTNIMSDGSKRFLFVLSEHKGKRGSNRDGNRNNIQGSPSRKNRHDTSDNRDTIEALLTEKMIETLYCRNGYLELEFTQIGERTEFVGECQESASNEDRVRWE